MEEVRLVKFLVLIQARCGSSRLPNKVLKDICGKTDLQWVIERVKRSKNIDEVMVITSIEKNNLPLIQKCVELDTRVFVGSENDVLDRYYQAAKLIKPEYVIRITADCPLFDWNYLDMAIEQIEPDTDYMGELTVSFPDGLDLEIIKYTALEKAWEEAKLASEREHVTQYIIKHPELFKHQNFECPIEGISNLRWTLDEDEDYELISEIYQHFVASKGMEDFTTEDVLGLIKEKPELLNINSKFARNEGLMKSLENDYVVS
ncbi:cytidylyltransferase domain-containing protein [Pseudobutyrivibrio sp. YE44]|uniref:cytidylyltransferase domain-containing protein n=1 Tax=Pseudobutyrivibrio sp. YE44 TaxID=1520802 RepID=UPI000B81B233|nr:glycosyltransferase family protein [Pseudobutyrivibrio sp. YE44]